MRRSTGSVERLGRRVEELGPRLNASMSTELTRQDKRSFGERRGMAIDRLLNLVNRGYSDDSYRARWFHATEDWWQSRMRWKWLYIVKQVQLYLWIWNKCLVSDWMHWGRKETGLYTCISGSERLILKSPAMINHGFWWQQYRHNKAFNSVDLRKVPC